MRQLKNSILMLILLFHGRVNAQILNKIGKASNNLVSGVKNTINTARLNRSIYDIYEEIEKKNFVAVKEKILEFKKEFTTDTRLDYLQYLFYNDPENLSYDPLIAKSYLTNAIILYNNYYSFQNLSAAQKDCIKINYCFDNLTNEMIKLDFVIYNKFKNSDDQLTKYINNCQSVYVHYIREDSLLSSSKVRGKFDYQNSVYYDSAINLRLSMRFNKALEDNTASAFVNRQHKLDKI